MSFDPPKGSFGGGGTSGSGATSIWTRLYGERLAGAGTFDTGVIAEMDMLMVMLSIESISAAREIQLRFNGDNGPNYDYGYNSYPTALAAAANQTAMTTRTGLTTECNGTIMIQNNASIRKAIQCSYTRVGGQTWDVAVGQWDNLVDRINRIEVFGAVAATFGAGSEIIVLGANLS